MNRPIKTRRLKKADFEADFFFMELVELRLYSTLRHLNAARYSQPFSHSTENVSILFRLNPWKIFRERDCANKMESNELGRIHSMCFCVKCRPPGEIRLVVRKSPWSPSW
jgi:hypothetical protein